MKNTLKKSIIALSIATLTTTNAFASVHTVVKGDTMWKISKQYETELKKLLGINTHIKNPEVIFPGDKVNVPDKDTKISNYEKEVVELVNQIRKENGLKALTIDEKLSQVAREKSQDMSDNNYFDHTSPTYGSPFDMMQKFGISYRSAAENIAKGQRSPEAVVDAWMNSSGHRKNILSPSYTHIGVGYVQKGNYWTQMFIGK